MACNAPRVDIGIGIGIGIGQAHRVQAVRVMSALLFAMNPHLAIPTRLDRCVHNARNALAAIAAATEVLERDDSPRRVLVEAGAVVARQARELAERVDELMTHARLGTEESETALVVSDDLNLVARVAGPLSHAGYRIELAVSTVAGYEALVRDQPDYAVIDLHTSAGDARSLARLARSAGFNGRLIAIEDAVATRGLPSTSSAAGFDAVLARSFELKVLHAAIPLE